MNHIDGDPANSHGYIVGYVDRDGVQCEVRVLQNENGLWHRAECHPYHGFFPFRWSGRYWDTAENAIEGKREGLMSND